MEKRTERGHKEVLAGMNIPSGGDGFLRVHIRQNSQLVHFRHIRLITYQLYLNKAFFKKKKRAYWEVLEKLDIHMQQNGIRPLSYINQFEKDEWLKCKT